MIVSFRDMAANVGEVRFHKQMDITDLVKERNDIIHSSPLQVDLKAKLADGAIEVDGDLSTELELICSRCLEHYRDALHIPFAETFAKVDNVDEDTDEESEINFTSEDKVDLDPYVEQTVWLELPYIPLCREDCLGLCPVCGGNRNEQACSCKQEKIDPRLAGLKDFFKDQA